MRNKNLIIALTTIVTLLCFFYISFTFIARSVQDDAVAQATDTQGNIDLVKKQQYLDSIYNQPVYNFLGFVPYTYKEVKELELALGLDLQGGMHVVVEVSPVEILKAMAGSNANKPEFKKAIAEATSKQRNSQSSFQSLFFEAYKNNVGDNQLAKIFANSTNKNIDTRAKDDDVIAIIEAEINESVDRSLNILRNRIDQFGVIQPNVQRIRGTGRILIELPGVENPQRVRNLISGTAKLEFLEVNHIWEVSDKLNRINEYLVANSDKATATNDSLLQTVSVDTTATKSSSLLVDDTKDTAKKEIAAADSAKKDTSKVSEFFKLLRDPNALVYEKTDTAKINRILALDRVKSIIGSDLELLWARKGMTTDDGKTYLELYPVKKRRDGKNALTGDVITNVGYSQDVKGYQVSMQMNTAGAAEWRRITKAAAQELEQSQGKVKRRIAIALDNVVYSAPGVESEIPNGSSVITGDFSLEEAKDLSTILKAGKLPAPVRIVEEVIVGPSLGQEAINDGMWSLIAGVLVVIVLIVMYYNKGGAIADIALLFNIIFTFGVLASFNSVLTLPGFAGIVLTLGMSIDANVLIFERIKEELNAGKSLSQSIKLGYDKAFSSIFDSNITTVLTGVILYYLGEGPVKGFATTLIIGVACSFFTAIYISKVILLWMVGDKENANIDFSTAISRNLFRNLNLNIISKRKFAYIFSSVLLIAGLGSVFLQGGLNLGVDFKGGRSYIVEFKDNVVASDVKNTVSEAFEGQGTEVKTFGAENKLKVTTSYLADDESNDADKKVEAALSTGLAKYNAANTFKILSSSKVGATVADDIKNASWKSILVSLIAIFVYILIRFRKWQFSLGGVVALFHDTLMVIAIFGLLRWFDINFEVDQVIVAALLTIVGFSINDTVIVFDRVREFTGEQASKMKMADLLNTAINSTLSRTIMTTVTVLVSVIILFAFGGETLRGFSFALLMGVIFGSYSTIFIAIPMVLDLRSKADKEADALKK